MDFKILLYKMHKNQLLWAVIDILILGANKRRQKLFYLLKGSLFIALGRLK